MFLPRFSLRKILFFVGKITITPENQNYIALPGDDVELKWEINGVEISNIDDRKWLFDRIPGVILAYISADGQVRKNNGTILSEQFDIKKPTTLILRNVDSRYDGKYKFDVLAYFKRVESVVTVLIAGK